MIYSTCNLCYYLIWPLRCYSINLSTLNVLRLKFIKLFIIPLIVVVIKLSVLSIVLLCSQELKCPKFRIYSRSSYLIILFWTTDNWNTHSISSPFGFSHALVGFNTRTQSISINYLHCKYNSSTKHNSIVRYLLQRLKGIFYISLYAAYINNQTIKKTSIEFMLKYITNKGTWLCIYENMLVKWRTLVGYLKLISKRLILAIIN